MRSFASTVRHRPHARTYISKVWACITCVNYIYMRMRHFRPFICANCVHVYTIERVYARAYICACTCIRVSLRLFTSKNANALSFVRMRAFACVRLRACLRADLIKTQNVFERKIFQHSNALWVQKLSGCTLGVSGIYGCCCKMVYRFPHIPYLYSSCICPFLQHPYFLFILKMFFFLVTILFCNLYNNIFAQYKHTYGRLRVSHEAI